MEQESLERMKGCDEVWSGADISNESDSISPEGKEKAEMPLSESSEVVAEESSAQMNEVPDSDEKPEDAPVQDVAAITHKLVKKGSRKVNKKKFVSDKSDSKDSTSLLNVYFSSRDLKKLRLISLSEGRSMSSIVKELTLEYLNSYSVEEC